MKRIVHRPSSGSTHVDLLLNVVLILQSGSCNNHLELEDNQDLCGENSQLVELRVRGWPDGVAVVPIKYSADSNDGKQLQELQTSI